MTRFLFILILFSIIYYPSSVTPSFAQEITPTITSSPKLEPQANEWEKFINNLIPHTLKQVNCGSLPSEVCQGINIEDASKKNDQKNQSVKPQGTEEKKDNSDIVKNAAGQYVIASGIHTPTEVSNASTNIIADFFNMLTKAIGDIFKRGEDGAQKYAGSVLPKDTVDQSFDKTATNMDQAFPLVACSGLPADLCTQNKPNAL